MNLAEVAERLDGKRKSGNGFMAKCPAHEDRKASLSVSEGEGGRVLLKCHAGCEIGAIVAAAGLRVTDLFPEPTKTQPNGAPTSRPAPLSTGRVESMAAALRADAKAWAHVTETLRLDPEVIRAERLGLHLGRFPRSTCERWLAYPYRHGGRWVFANCRSLDGEKDFRRLPAGQPTSLYRADHLKDGGTAILVEGEKDALAALSMGLAAELGNGDSGATVVAIPGVEHVRMAAEALQKQARVYVAVDADAAGDTAAGKLCEALGPKATRLRPPAKDFGELLQTNGPEKALELALAALQLRDPLPTALLPGRRLLETTYPPLAFVVRPYVPRAEAIEIVGPHGHLKSTIALDLALAVATGRRWGGVEVTPGKSAFITLEDREAVIAWRVEAYLAGIEDTAERAAARKAIAENFAFLAREQAEGLALTFTDRTGTTPRDDIVARITKLVTERALVILETTSRLHPGPESNEGLIAFGLAVERIATTSGAACGVVRHTPKDTARDTDKEPDSYWGRGGGAFSDLARSVLAVRRDKDNDDPDFATVRLHHVKPPPFSGRGAQLAWKPTRVDPNLPDGPIYLRPVGQAEQDLDLANKMHGFLRELPDGFPKSDIKKKGKLPSGFTQDAAKRALQKLVIDHRATFTEETRGRTNQKAWVYRAVVGEP